MPARHYQPYHLALVPVVGIAVTGTATLLLAFLILLIHRKRKELKITDNVSGPSPEGFPPPPHRKFPEGLHIRPCSFSSYCPSQAARSKARTQRKGCKIWVLGKTHLMLGSVILVTMVTLFGEVVSGPRSTFQRFSYKETRRATNNFGTMIGKGGFGTVYRAEFGDDLVVAVKRMNRVSEQAEDEFCREMELLGRLHHRHLVALRGYCIKKRERWVTIIWFP